MADRLYDTEERQERIILVGVETAEGDDTRQSLEELEELGQTAGAVTVGMVIQKRERMHPGTYIGKGKIEEVAQLVRSRQADTVVCDDELSPAQLRNLSDALDVKVIDRTVMILDIFAKHATTNEGKLQVELAQLRYRSSHLIGERSELSRLGGAVYPKEALKAVADVCVKHDLYIISDEIYDKLVYDGVPFTSVAALSDEIKAHTILINGVSKTYAMTGWRIGYALSPAPVAKAMTNYLSHSTGAPGTMCQCAAIEALSGPQDEAEQMRQVFEQRRDLIVRRINAMPGVSCLKPSGAFYVMMNLEQIIGKQIDGQVIGSGDDFAKLLLEKSLVAVVPGSGFGAPNFVRLSYAISTENIETGMDRLEAFLKQLQ